MILSKSSEKEITRIVDHLSNCGDCAREFNFLLEVSRSEIGLKEDIGKLRYAEKLAEGPKKETKGIFGSWAGQRPLFSRISRSTAFSLAGFVAVAITVSLLMLFRTPEKYRTGSGPQIRLLQPTQERLPSSSVLFKWKEIRNTKYYRLKLFDGALSPLWESEEILNDYFVLPNDAAKMLEAGRPYFWMITAHCADGEDILSPLAEFSIKK